LILLNSASQIAGIIGVSYFTPLLFLYYHKDICSNISLILQVFFMPSASSKLHFFPLYPKSDVALNCSLIDAPQHPSVLSFYHMYCVNPYISPAVFLCNFDKLTVGEINHTYYRKFLGSSLSGVYKTYHTFQVFIFLPAPFLSPFSSSLYRTSDSFTFVLIFVCLWYWGSNPGSPTC
jgi:hypothetical protein